MDKRTNEKIVELAELVQLIRDTGRKQQEELLGAHLRKLGRIEADVREVIDDPEFRMRLEAEIGEFSIRFALAVVVATGFEKVTAAIGDVVGRLSNIEQRLSESNEIAGDS